MPVGFDAKSLEKLVKWQDELTDSKLFPFTQLLISKGGKEVYYHDNGVQELGTNKAISRDHVSRIYSMTKPISSLALMILFEEGKVQLTDPVHLYLGEKWKKKNMQVLASDGEALVPCEKSITVKMVLTHTSGLSYGFDLFGTVNPVDKKYFDNGFLQRRPKSPEGSSSFSDHHNSLKDFIDNLSEMPLLFQPGTAFNYGYSTDVVGRLVEVISGQDYADFVRERILIPLRMNHTDFCVKKEDLDADLFTTLYRHPLNASGRGIPKNALKLKGMGPTGRQWTDKQTLFKPGEGLVSTVGDYALFCEMLRNGGELFGNRIISPKTLEFMVSNHLRVDEGPTAIGVNLNDIVHPKAFGDAAVGGVGFGLGLAVITDPPSTNMTCSKGTFFWSGAASTIFWVDPMEDIVVVFFTQVMHVDQNLIPLRKQLSNIIYGALTKLESKL